MNSFKIGVWKEIVLTFERYVIWNYRFGSRKLYLIWFLEIDSSYF
jgi:hypothetical protein